MTSTKTAKSRYSNIFIRSGLFILLIAVGVSIWQYSSIKTWHHVRKVKAATELADAQHHVGKIAERGAPAVPVLLELLQSNNPLACKAAADSLQTFTSQEDTANLLLEQFPQQHDQWSLEGKVASVELLTKLAQYSPTGVEVARQTMAKWVLTDSVVLREQAIVLCLHEKIQQPGTVVPLLDDPEPKVRRGAMLAVGPTKLVPVEKLVTYLHDEDQQVQELCTVALKSRGLTYRDIHLGRLYSSPDMHARHRLLVELLYDSERDVSVWLQRLCSDHDPAMRAGAVRVAARREERELWEDTKRVATQDPNTTVRQIADYYSSQITPVNARLE
ncbi:MAG: hypothetical protein R3B84_10400 [Zavarzinella sp.]